MKRVFILLAMFVTLNAVAQSGYNFTIELADLPNETILLAYNYNESTFIKDSTRTDAVGIARFKGEQKLPEGVYIIAHNSAKMFDFVLSQDQTFSLSTHGPDYYKNMQVDGDLDNRLYFENLVFNSEQNQKAKPFVEITKDDTKSEDEIAEAKRELGELNEEVDAYQKKLIANYPQTLVSRILKARQRIEIPDPPARLSEKEVKSYKYRYYRKNFWNNIDLSDDAMIRLPFPLLQDKMDEYFGKIMPQNADTLIREIDRFIAQTKSNPETYKFFTWSLTTRYYSPEVMGLDKIFVHMYDTYFKSGEMDYWVDDNLMKTVSERAEQLRLSLVGMKAPNLIMQDANEKPRSLHDIQNKYTILYFYDPDCGHCKEETPVLVEFANNTTFDVQVYSVSADTSMAKMKEFIKEMDMGKWVNVNGPRTYVGHYQKLYDAFQTPSLYILNEEKKIIAKKLPAEKLEDFFSKYATKGK